MKWFIIFLTSILLYLSYGCGHIKRASVGVWGVNEAKKLSNDIIDEIGIKENVGCDKILEKVKDINWNNHHLKTLFGEIFRPEFPDIIVYQYDSCRGTVVFVWDGVQYKPTDEINLFDTRNVWIVALLHSTQDSNKVVYAFHETVEIKPERGVSSLLELIKGLVPQTTNITFEKKEEAEVKSTTVNFPLEKVEDGEKNFYIGFGKLDLKSGTVNRVNISISDKKDEKPQESKKFEDRYVAFFNVGSKQIFGGNIGLAYVSDEKLPSNEGIFSKATLKPYFGFNYYIYRHPKLPFSGHSVAITVGMDLPDFTKGGLIGLSFDRIKIGKEITPIGFTAGVHFINEKNFWLGSPFLGISYSF